jgi:peptidoglycan/LPS O-acetylase OafA/YrhL
VKLELSREERRARRDPATTVAIAISGVAALWEIAVLIISRGSDTWLTGAAMLAVIPVVLLIAVVTQSKAWSAGEK